MKLSKWCKDKGIHYNTGVRWFHEGLIPGAYQVPTGTILVDEVPIVKENNQVWIYARVSNHNRKKDLEAQVQRCTEFCLVQGLAIQKIYKEVASGMNDNRRELWKLLDNKPTKIVVEHKDRLTRFGFNYLEKLLAKLGCQLIVINKDKEDETDLIKDLVSIITSFCCRLYGLRKGKNKVKVIKEVLV